MDHEHRRMVIRPFPHLFVRLPQGHVGDGEWRPALRAEVELRRKSGESVARPARSVFVAAGDRGWDAGVSRSLLEAVGETSVGTGTEWTLEVDAGEAEEGGRPPILPPEVVRAWADAGVNRVSLACSPSSSRRDGLRGTAHEGGRTPEAWAAAVDRLMAGGIPTVSVDLPLGREAGSPAGAGALAIASGILEVGIPQVAIREAEGTRDPIGWLTLRRRLGDAGYDTGDGVHFFRSGCRPVHPRGILRREPVLGIGPGAVTFRNPVRRANVRKWRRYRMVTFGGGDPFRWQEHLTDREVRTERIWCRLRSREGLRVQGMGVRARRRIDDWVVRGMARMEAGRVILTESGWLQGDGLAVDLLAEEEADRHPISGPRGPISEPRR
jgi:hypothetical protein